MFVNYVEREIFRQLFGVVAHSVWVANDDRAIEALWIMNKTTPEFHSNDTEVQVLLAADQWSRETH